MTAYDWIENKELARCMTERDRLRAVNDDLLAALNRSLSWLSSYPGGGAIEAYNQARAAVARAEQGKP